MYSGLTLLATNLIFASVALLERWDLKSIMVVYVFQSIVIGAVNIIRIVQLQKFSTEGFTSNGVRPPENEETKKSTAGFFAIHFGFFHVVYLVFVIGMPSSQSIPWMYIFASTLLFAINHIYSYKVNRAKDAAKVHNIGKVMFWPYARIIPMHITIIAGSAYIDKTGASMAALAIFLGLKTLADLLMHYIEHKGKEKDDAPMQISISGIGR